MNTKTTIKGVGTTSGTSNEINVENATGTLISVIRVKDDGETHIDYSPPRQVDDNSKEFEVSFKVKIPFHGISEEDIVRELLEAEQRLNNKSLIRYHLLTPKRFKK